MCPIHGCLTWLEYVDQILDAHLNFCQNLEEQSRAKILIIIFLRFIITYEDLTFPKLVKRHIMKLETLQNELRTQFIQVEISDCKRFLFGIFYGEQKAKILKGKNCISPIISAQLFPALPKKSISLRETKLFTIIGLIPLKVTLFFLPAWPSRLGEAGKFIVGILEIPQVKILFY